MSYGPSCKQEEHELLEHFMPVLFLPPAPVAKLPARDFLSLKLQNCCAETCSQFRRLQSICKFMVATGWAAKPYCRPGNSSRQVKERTLEDLLCLSSLPKQGSYSRSCTALLRSDRLAGVWDDAVTRSACRLCLGKEVGRKETCMKMVRLSSLKLSSRRGVLPDRHQAKCSRHQLGVSVHLPNWRQEWQRGSRHPKSPCPLWFA